MTSQGAEPDEKLGRLLRLDAALTAEQPGRALTLYARSIRPFVHEHFGWILSSKRYVADGARG